MVLDLPVRFIFPVVPHGHINSRRLKHVSVEESVADAFAVRALVEDVAPRVDDHRVPIRLSPLIMLPALSGGDDVHLVLDCSCAQENLPVRSSGGDGERSRNQNYFRSRARLVDMRSRSTEGAIELRES